MAGRRPAPYNDVVITNGHAPGRATTMNDQMKKDDVRNYYAGRPAKTALVRASISPPRSGLYYIAADATPHNLEHSRDMVRVLDDGAGRTSLSLSLSAQGAPVPVAEIENLAEELTREGIDVRFSVDIDPYETDVGDSELDSVFIPGRSI
jgi:hypothetical protein